MANFSDPDTLEREISRKNGKREKELLKAQEDALREYMESPGEPVESATKAPTMDPAHVISGLDNEMARLMLEAAAGKR